MGSGAAYIYGCYGAANGEAGAVRQSLDGGHGQTIGGGGGGADLPGGWQCYRCRLCDAGGGMYHAYCADLGWRDAGAYLQSQDREGHRDQCAWMGAYGSDAGFFQKQRV